MSPVEIYARRLVVILVGYFTACLVASISFLMVGALSLNDPSLPALATIILMFGPLIAFGFGWQASLHTAGAVLILEAFRRREWLSYAIAGAIIGAIVAYPNWSDLPIPEGEELPDMQIRSAYEFWAVVGSATVGGVAYWLVAGREAGVWWKRAERQEDDVARRVVLRRAAVSLIALLVAAIVIFWALLSFRVWRII